MREEEKKAAILKAEGDAEAAQLLSDAILKSGEGIIAIRKIEAAQHIVNMLHRSPNVTFVAGNTTNLLNLNPGRL